MHNAIMIPEIPGTRARKIPKNSSPPEVAPSAIPPESATIERRKLLQNAVPALGAGLAKLLRASNNLKRDLTESFEERAKHKSAAVEKKQRE